MRSIEDIGLLAIAFGWGWITWRYFKNDYERAKEKGGPEWVKIQRLTVWSVIGATIIGTVLTAFILMWLEGN